MDEKLKRLIVEARERYEKLSPVEKMSMFAQQSIGYVASETFMGVIEDAGDFAEKKATALGALRWIESALNGNADHLESHRDFLQRIWLLTPDDLERTKRKLSTIIKELEMLDKSEEGAVRFL